MIDILKHLQDSPKNLFVGMAGPGTGKSYTFKTIVHSEDFRGKKILILSFINKLVNDLTEDFRDVDTTTVSTLHSFAVKQIGDVDLEPDLDKIISEDHLFIKGEALNYEEKFNTNTLSEDEENFYKERRDFYKHKKKLYSFNSVIYAANKLFGHDKAKIPNAYDLILIDEFQDFNKLEFEFINFLNQNCKIILVGDDNQSLYSFKRADPGLIRALYRADHTEEFSLDYCFRCTEVLVDATNDLVKVAKERGFLQDGLDKNFLYPRGQRPEKDQLSDEFNKIDFIPAVLGARLIYKLEEDIKKQLKNSDQKKRILVLAPGYLKQTIYDGLMRKGFNVVEYELFANEERHNFPHRYLIDSFEALKVRKTDNLALRKILNLYLSHDDVQAVLLSEKKIWSVLPNEVRKKIEADIEIIKKVQKGEDHLNQNELLRFNQIFNIKKLLSRMIKGFAPVAKDAIQIELTTVTSSKGLSADYVYYIGIDDENLLNKESGVFTDQKICEFLVGITRAKEKLTLISLRDKDPKILSFIDPERINRIEDR